MTPKRLAIYAGGAVAAVGVILLLVLLHGSGGDEDTGDVTPTATITAVPVRKEALQELANVYGVVQADPSGTATVAAPRPLIVLRVLVRPGQVVTAGEPLAEVANAPAAELAWRQAADAVKFAQADLDRVQRLYAQKLVASDQLDAARKTLADAQAALAAQHSQGADERRQTLSAPVPAIVTSVPASPGDHLAQDAPVVVLARQGAVTARLTLEPSAGRFEPGQVVTLRPVWGGPTISSHLTQVAHAADPTTKTVDAVAALGAGSPPIGSAVEADVVTGMHDALVVPRGSVVFDETGTHVFTISSGKAHRVFVKVGRDHGDDVEVEGPLTPGQPVAVEGAYELQDGMDVKVAGR
ncbi:MAG: efflux RND transporter periplasmic adaptor subunit [Caulobacteraceae bacterium]|nr:efflux RND transporter periplasmic adaptor subunit [Caulobacteraceae bacterium]